MKELSANVPVMFGRYVLLSVLAEGERSVVHLARHVDDAKGEAVVLKRFRGSLSAQPAVERLERLIAPPAVRDKALSFVRAAGQVEHTRFVVTDYLDGVSLSTILRAREYEPTPVLLAVAIIQDVLDALIRLARFSSLGLERPFHGRLSPSRIMIDSDVRAGLIGLDAEPGRFAELGYTPPEQVVEGTIDARVDVFSTGAILYELITGRKLIPVGSLAERRRRSLNPVYESPRSLGLDLSPRLDAVLKTALSVEASDRFDSCAAFRDALIASAGPLDRERDGAFIPSALRDAHEATRVRVDPRFVDGSIPDFYRPGETVSVWGSDATAPTGRDSLDSGETASDAERSWIDLDAPTDRTREADTQPVVVRKEAGPALEPRARPASRVAVLGLGAVLMVALVAVAGSLALPDGPTARPTVPDASVMAVDLPPRARARATPPADDREPEPDEAPDAASPSPTPEPAKDTRRPKRLTRIRPGKKDTQPVAAPTEADRIKSLIERVRALRAERKRAGMSEEVGQLDRLLRRLALEMSANPTGRAERIDRIEKELEAW